MGRLCIPIARNNLLVVIPQGENITARRELHLDRQLTWHVYQRHAIVATGRQDFNFRENADTEIIPVCCLKEHRDEQEEHHSRYEL
jgi:hypothetical protein